MTAWPPDVTALKRDLDLPVQVGSGDVVLAAQLDAAVAVVERIKAGAVNFRGEAPLLPSPDADLVLGTVRLAGRYYTRRRSPDNLISAGDYGTSRVPSFDADIERLLRIGRYGPPVIA